VSDFLWNYASNGHMIQPASTNTYVFIWHTITSSWHWQIMYRTQLIIFMKILIRSVHETYERLIADPFILLPGFIFFLRAMHCIGWYVLCMLHVDAICPLFTLCLVKLSQATVYLWPNYCMKQSLGELCLQQYGVAYMMMFSYFYAVLSKPPDCLNLITIFFRL